MMIHAFCYSSGYLDHLYLICLPKFRCIHDNNKYTLLYAKFLWIHTEIMKYSRCNRLTLSKIINHRTLYVNRFLDNVNWILFSDLSFWDFVNNLICTYCSYFYIYSFMFVSNNMKPDSIEDYFQQKVLCIPNYLKTAKNCNSMCSWLNSNYQKVIERLLS